ncbi:MAG: FkbM family methyltransferase [Fibromonadales bacterium]|nr:FkbM family methyltransferase [Fibromonadales bacterium]
MAEILIRPFDFIHKKFYNNLVWLKGTFIWRIIHPIWSHSRAWAYNKSYSREARVFFQQNAERVKRITDFFYDEESRNTFDRMINFRQTSKKNYHISHGCQTQYFINDFFAYGKNEVFIDCGALDGDTVENFLRLPNMEYEQIIAFEPSAENFKIMEEKFNNKKIILINAGVYSKDCELYFLEYRDGSRVSETPIGAKEEIKVKVKVKAIDNLQISKKVTFIKMDIEGAEIEALKGAKNTILRDKPRLAISIYHSDEDMLRIAEWVHATVPEYKLYCRHHSTYPSFCETILYAQV